MPDMLLYGPQQFRRLGSTVLNAFADVEPNSADVDEIRQWLISRKQSMDWGYGPQQFRLSAGQCGRCPPRLLHHDGFQRRLQ